MDGRWSLLVSALTLTLVLGLGHGQKIRSCTNRSLINVILMNDDESPWSMKFVRGKVEQAIDQVNTDAAGEVVY